MMPKIGRYRTRFKAMIYLGLPTPYPYTSNGLTALKYFKILLNHHIDRSYYKPIVNKE